MNRPILRWFGGKFLLAPWIISHFPKHRIYVEPFGGAASVLMQKERTYAEVYNDLDDSVYSLFKVMSRLETCQDLRLQLEQTPFSRREFVLAHDYHPDPVESARRLIIRSFMGFGSDSAADFEKKTGFRNNSSRSGTTPAHDWVNYAKELPKFMARLKGVVIENRDAIELIKQLDHKDALFYCDPPYPHDTRSVKHGYRFEMVNHDHESLLKTLMDIDGAAVVSGYANPMYDKILKGWKRVEKGSYADGAKKRIEVLWINKP
jgi:DNA adenine methylase